MVDSDETAYLKAVADFAEWEWSFVKSPFECSEDGTGSAHKQLRDEKTDLGLVAARKEQAHIHCFQAISIFKMVKIHDDTRFFRNPLLPITFKAWHAISNWQ